MQLWVRVERQVFVWVKGRQELLRLVSFQTPSSRDRSRSHKCWIRRTGSGNETSTSCPRASRCQGSFGNWTLYVHACRMLSFRYCVCRTLRSTAHLRALPSQGIKFTNLCVLGPKFFNTHKFLPIYTSRCSEMEEASQQWEWCSN